MRIYAVIAAVLLAVSCTAAGEPERGDSGMGTAILLKFNNEELTVRLNDSQASRDFVAMLPATLTFRDYNATEKVSDLPKRLSLVWPTRPRILPTQCQIPSPMRGKNR